MKKITITEALVELKLLDARIIKATNQDWVACIKKSEGKEPREEFEKKVKANYQSVMDLIRERNDIKSAIVKSNALTTLKVGDVEMTVAEAIERKSSILYEEDLLSRWKNQYATAQNREQSLNKEVEYRLDEMLKALLGSEKAEIGEAQKSLSENYLAMNGAEILDPINLKEKIGELEAKIETFKGNVDTALSLSNATTFIEV